MFRFDRVILAVIALAFGLSTSACSTSGNTWDPTDLLPESVFGSKEKLKGDRKAVFPEGVPGVPEGVPPELIRGNQQAGIEAQSTPPATPTVTQAATATPSAKPAPAPEAAQPAKPKPKPKPKIAGSPLALPGARSPVPPPPQQSAPPTDHSWPDPSQTSVPTPKTSTY